MDITRSSGSEQYQAALGLAPGAAADSTGMFAACDDIALKSFLNTLTQPGTSAQTAREQFDGLNAGQLESLAALINKQNRPERMNLLCTMVEKLADGRDRHRLEKMRGYFLQSQNNSQEPHSVYAEFSRIDQNQQAGQDIKHEEITAIAAEIFTSPPRRAAVLFNSLDRSHWMPEFARELGEKHLQPLVVLLKRLGDNPDVNVAQFATLADTMMKQIAPSQKAAFAMELDRAGCFGGAGDFDPRMGVAGMRSGPMAAFASVVLASVPNIPQPA